MTHQVHLETTALLLRYERKSEHVLAFFGVAALLVGYRRLTKTVRA
ncbi:hypothetical protein [Streptomyces sp. 8P21H-1]|nr:hypothetical protein [Streptomyces sp. 8P21H-1]